MVPNHDLSINFVGLNDGTPKYLQSDMAKASSTSLGAITPLLKAYDNALVMDGLRKHVVVAEHGINASQSLRD
ncbi:hypothetical protein AC578_11002 [Pseudocercospora eumusae]|uniref:Uncharacterized protein n=1 Tax=Pseudocercospora eumusae TaxID=321146 RepID=A0A139HSH0_9PEZI|nr:hypothetical protein AC578_11002 [Pseudocercospora eumusae]